MNKSHSPGSPSKLLVGLVVTSLIVSCVAITLAFLSSQSEIVYVDAQKLVNGYRGMQDARKEFENKSAVWKANLDTLRNEVEAKVKEYELTGARLSAREQALMEELIESRQQQFINYQQIISEKVAKEDQELTSKVLSHVNDYIKRYGKEKRYKIILAATQYGNIAYAEEHTDITVDVLDGLNLEYSK